MGELRSLSEELIRMGHEAFFPQEQLFEKTCNKKCLKIGIPKEDALHETRIPLTPQGVSVLVDTGHEVIIEQGAGDGANYPDVLYAEAGAFIVQDRKLVFNQDIILKMTPPTCEEAEMMKERSVLFSLLKLSSLSENVVKSLIARRVTAIAVDLFTDSSGDYPVVRSLSEIEGRMAVMIGAYELSKMGGGKGVLLGGITGVSPTEVVVLGAETAGLVAAQTAISMGATVKLFDHSIAKLSHARSLLRENIFTSTLHPISIEKALTSADVVIGALRFLNGSRRFVVTESQVQLMKPGSVVVDLSVDQGGCFATTVPTTINNPTYTKYYINHVCLPSLSVLGCRTASIALSNVMANVLEEIGFYTSIDTYLRNDHGFCKGIWLYNGILTNHFLGSHFSLPSKDLGLLLAAY